MPGRTPSTLNIQIGTHVFTRNPSKMDTTDEAARTIAPNLLGNPIAIDLLKGAEIRVKRVWKFSGIDDGDLDFLRTAQKTPGAVAFRDIYGDTHSVFIDAQISSSVEGRRTSYPDYSFSLREA